MQGVSESMAGRAAVLQLLPLSVRETPKVSLLRGGYPEVLARPGGARLWLASYLQTYLERDVRAVTAVKDLATFRRFLALLASRHGQISFATSRAWKWIFSCPAAAVHWPWWNARPVAPSRRPWPCRCNGWPRR